MSFYQRRIVRVNIELAEKCWEKAKADPVLKDLIPEHLFSALLEVSMRRYLERSSEFQAELLSKGAP